MYLINVPRFQVVTTESTDINCRAVEIHICTAQVLLGCFIHCQSRDQVPSLSKFRYNVTEYNMLVR